MAFNSSGWKFGDLHMSVVRQFETDQAFREERLWLIRVRV